jgi:hypothetical protein
LDNDFDYQPSRDEMLVFLKQYKKYIY